MNSTDTDEIVRDPSQPDAADKQADFHAIANDAIKRGFEITPLGSNGKVPFLRGWQKRPSKDPRQIEEWAAQFPNSNAGVVCKCRVGGTISLDFDAEGVIEQIENDTGRAMPVTYVVQSRPKSAPC